MVGLDNLAEPLWKDHIVHAVIKHQQAKRVKEEEATTLENKLLKLQIAKLTDQVENKAVHDILAAPVMTQPAPQVPSPVPPAAPEYQQRAPMPPAPPVSGPPPYHPGGGGYSNVLCWNCGQIGHFSQSCR